MKDQGFLYTDLAFVSFIDWFDAMIDPESDEGHLPYSGDIDGLPPSLEAGSVCTLFDGGGSLAIASGECLKLYHLTIDRDRAWAREIDDHHLPAPVVALGESMLGLVLVVERDCSESSLFVLKDDHLVRLIDLPGKVEAFATAGIHAFAVLQETKLPSRRLIQVQLRQRAVVAERPLPNNRVTLSVDPAGRHLVVTDTQARTVNSFAPGLAPIPQEAMAVVPDREQGPHALNCCCMVCQPCHDGHSSHPSGSDKPETDRAERPGTAGDDGRTDGAPHRPPTGDAATPTDDGGVVVADGGRVTHHPPKGRGWRLCGLNLFHPVADMLRVGGYFLSADRQARTVSLLSADMNLLDQWRFGRGGAMLLTAQGSPLLIMHHRKEGTWTWRDVHRSVATLRPDLTLYPLLPTESKTFIGQQVYALSHGRQPSPTAIKALLLPVIEKDQSYTSPDLSGFTAFMKRTMEPVAQNYYDENSFGILKDVTIDVFDVKAGAETGPLKLPRGKIADYYYPAYEPARVELLKSGVKAADRVVFDGREKLTLTVKPLTGGVPGGTLDISFFALALQHDNDLFPFQIKFIGTERLTVNLTLPDGSAKSLTLAFTAKTIDIADDSQVSGKLSELASYLDTIMAAAETAAGIGSRIFSAPSAVRIPMIGMQFGRLLVTFKSASTTGNKLQVTGTSSVHPSGDPLSLSNAIAGAIRVWDSVQFGRYFANAALLAQEAAGFGYNNRMLEAPATRFDAAAQTLTTTISIARRQGGPGAEVQFVSASGLETFFDTASAKPNSATTANSAEALRDRTDLYRDAFSAAIARLRAAGRATDELKSYGCVLIMPVEPPDAAAIRPGEMWNVTPLHRPFGFRGAENVTTVIDRVDEKVQLQSAWALIFMTGGAPDNPLICHELGHAIGYADLYHQEGYRDELAYMGDWAMMDNHPPFTHHCGYHKLQSGWIPEGAGTETDYGRVYPIGLPAPDATRSWDILLVPVELWRDSLVGSARSAFGVGSDVPVVQLAWIDLGGDGATFCLVEARQRGANFSRNLPLPDGGVLITNGIIWTLDERFATNTWYRRPLQLLNPSNVLRNVNDEFDLARAPELPVKGVKVRVTDRKTVEGDAEVYRLTITRENAEFVDLYFENPEVYWKNPDLWVDWAGNNKPTPETLTPDFGLGQPTDQGEAIRPHLTRSEQHWLVARLRNRGQVPAKDVKLNFFYYEPPGGGDGGKPMDAANISHYKLIGSTTHPEVPAGNAPVKILKRWDVPAGFKGHTCLLVQIEDYRIPEDSSGAALGSEDVWQVNNHAQKNVDKYEALSASPFKPIEFEFSVHNAGVSPEVAYLEPEGLPYGMTLTVTPPVQTIGSGSTAVFQCRLELDERIIRTGCENDQRFRIHAWRQDPESSARWGGVEYEIKPREMTSTQLGGTWDYSNIVTFDGLISPNPGGGIVHIRIDFDGHQARWHTVPASANGKFTWSGAAPDDSFVVEAVAWYEGNRKFGSSRSNVAKVAHPPIIK